ncbi:Rqc2 family fibronectin-binding protein [Oceanirhabdus sp. W0125-5]|uniref:Rqc2 family fibronectin-binding protein n=1 Tax=Oceanirhabdus sp. W0125-5 TaxID=2999116 RepID=UPI0022F2D409|nr:NFACT RNA binding domain-containing protein [Oceanirhabdus sp. W0125-5]WBW95341.1 NFACT RNA binding domain-containing protein [Oceanirhabdus sp. W0125-5]
MALDGFFLKSLTEELSKELIGRRVEKISQPEKDEIILNFKINRKNRGLLISASSNYPRIHFTDIKKENPLSAPMFCMVLRKYLKGARVLDIQQLTTDRVLNIVFESTDELGFVSNFILIVEIMGRHSNISLVRNSDNIIMDSIKHIGLSKNTYRTVLSGLPYVYPPESKLLDPYNFTKEDLLSKLKELDFSEKIFSRIFTGFGAELSKELLYRLDLKGDENTDSIISRINQIQEILEELKINNKNFGSYTLDGYLKTFHCVELSHLINSHMDFNKFDNPSELCEKFYYEKDLQDRMHGKSAEIHKLVSNNIDRCAKKIKILEKTLVDCKKRDKYQLYGELLTSFIHSVEEGSEKVSLLNYYVTDKEEYVEITLDPNKTVSENIQKYYKRYNKMKKSEEMAQIQLTQAKEELSYLNSVLVNISNCRSTGEISEIKKELIESGYLKKKKSKKKVKEGKSAPLHFVSSDGIDIYVGKNNLQNDYLTLKFASKNDIWMHTKDIPGSHVIVKNSGNIPESTLDEAANLAAYYSKGKNSTKVPVDYTEVKNVKKPSGSKPGMVIYYTNKTFFIDPVEPKLEEVE